MPWPLWPSIVSLTTLLPCTMTCNPQWPKIVQNLRTGQTTLNTPHLVSRVFRQYFNAFISDLWDNGVLGRGIDRIHVIKFQKRGYPHAHILLTVRQEDKLRDAGTLTPWSLLRFQIGKSCLYLGTMSLQLWWTVHVVQIARAMCIWDAMSAPKTSL